LRCRRLRCGLAARLHCRFPTGCAGIGRLCLGRCRYPCGKRGWGWSGSLLGRSNRHGPFGPAVIGGCRLLSRRRFLGNGDIRRVRGTGARGGLGQGGPGRRLQDCLAGAMVTGPRWRFPAGDLLRMTVRGRRQADGAKPCQRGGVQARAQRYQGPAGSRQRRHGASARGCCGYRPPCCRTRHRRHPFRRGRLRLGGAVNDFLPGCFQSDCLTSHPRVRSSSIRPGFRRFSPLYGIPAGCLLPDLPAAGFCCRG